MLVVLKDGLGMKGGCRLLGLVGLGLSGPLGLENGVAERVVFRRARHVVALLSSLGVVGGCCKGRRSSGRRRLRRRSPRRRRLRRRSSGRRRLRSLAQRRRVSIRAASWSLLRSLGVHHVLQKSDVFTCWLSRGARVSVTYLHGGRSALHDDHEPAPPFYSFQSSFSPAAGAAKNHSPLSAGRIQNSYYTIHGSKNSANA